MSGMGPATGTEQLASFPESKMHPPRHLLFITLSLLLSAAPTATRAGEPGMATADRHLTREIEQMAPSQVELLRQLVEIPSPTGDTKGIRAAGDLLASAFLGSGFTTRWAAEEGGPEHLIAERAGTGPTVALVTHLDTVYQEPWPWRREGTRAWGPGINDDKGSAVVALGALQALAESKRLGDLHIILLATADEESPGGRRVLHDALAGADLILGFEPGVAEDLGIMVTGRRGFVAWDLEATADEGLPRHSSRSTREGGFGAALECARTIDAFGRIANMYNTLTVNVAAIAAGDSVKPVDGERGFSVEATRNSIPDSCHSFGEIRGLAEPDVTAAVAWMHSAAEAHSLGTSSKLNVKEIHRPWAPSSIQDPAWALLAAVHSDLGIPAPQADDPMHRGASDLNAVADLGIPQIDGWGIPGGLAHTPPSTVNGGEWADLDGMTVATKRLALFLDRVARGQLGRTAPAHG